MRTLALVVVLVGVSCRSTPEVTAPPTHVPGGATTARPSGPGPANLAFSCVPPRPTCDDPSYNIAVLGDRVETCEVWSREATVRLQLKSSNDPRDGILIAFDGYHGSGSYSLNQPSTRFVQVDDDVAVATCSGPNNVGKRVTAADPSCGSPACSVVVYDASPDAGFPKPLTFTVHCTSLCENGGDVTCQGPIDFIVRATCG